MADNKIQGDLPCKSKAPSLVGNFAGKDEDIAKVVKASTRYFGYTVCKDDNECMEMLNDFFKDMAENGEFPTVEKMALSLGTTRKTIWEWEHGSMGVVRSNIIKKAKEILASIDAELVNKNMIPQIVYIFRAKNFFGMVDKQEHVLTPNNPLGDGASQEDIQQRLLDGTAEED